MRRTLALCLKLREGADRKLLLARQVRGQHRQYHAAQASGQRGLWGQEALLAGVAGVVHTRT